MRWKKKGEKEELRGRLGDENEIKEKRKRNNRNKWLVENGRIEGRRYG